MTVYDRRDVRAEAAALGVRCGTLAEAASRAVVVFGVPVQYLEEVLRESRAFLRPDALLLDVASVKVRPLALLQRYATPTAEICGLHPLFGPQSGQRGSAGLNITICPFRTTRYAQVANHGGSLCKQIYQHMTQPRRPRSSSKRVMCV